MAASKKFGAPFQRCWSKLYTASVRDEKYNDWYVEVETLAAESLDDEEEGVVELLLEEEEVLLEDDEVSDPSTGISSPQATQREGHTMLWLKRTSYSSGELFFQHRYESSSCADPRFMFFCWGGCRAAFLIVKERQINKICLSTNYCV